MEKKISFLCFAVSFCLLLSFPVQLFAQQEEGVAVRGHVLSHFGGPVPEALVKMKADGFSKETASDDNGMYSIAGCPIGKQILVVCDKPGFTIYSAGIKIVKAVPEVNHSINLEQQIPLESGYKEMLQGKTHTLLNGFVYDDAYQPAQGALVMVNGEDFSGKAETDELGMYTIPDCPLGTEMQFVCIKDNYKVFNIGIVMWRPVDEWSHTINLEPLDIVEYGK